MQLRLIFILAIWVGACADKSSPSKATRPGYLPQTEFVENYSPDPGSKLRLCRSSVVPNGTSLGGISFVLGRNDLFSLAGDEECSVEIRSEPSDLSLRIKTRFANCHLAVESRSGIVTKLQFAVDFPSETELQKCFFRVGLWATGQTTHPLKHDEDLIIPLDETLFWGLSTMPQVIPNIPLPDQRKN